LRESQVVTKLSSKKALSKKRGTITQTVFDVLEECSKASWKAFLAGATAEQVNIIDLYGNYPLHLVCLVSTGRRKKKLFMAILMMVRTMTSSVKAF
jgi:hypothetical protein